MPSTLPTTRRKLRRGVAEHGLVHDRVAPIGALTRFTDARALVAYVGFYPVIPESGDRAATPRLSRVGSRIARQSLYLAAVNVVRRSGE